MSRDKRTTVQLEADGSTQEHRIPAHAGADPTTNLNDQRRRGSRIPRHVLVAASGWISRILSASIQLVSVRILLQTLGLDDYALFALLVGLQGWFLLADLGLGVSTQNHISEARANGNRSDSFTDAGRMLAAILLVITIAILYGLSPCLSSLLLRAFPQWTAKQKSELFFLVGSLSIGIGIGSLVYKVWYSEHRGYLANVVPALASSLGLAALTFVHLLPQERRLTGAVLAFVGPTAIVPLGILFWQFATSGRFRCKAHVIGALLKRGVAFWVFAVFAACTLQVDYIVISQFLPADEIAVYNLTSKVYGLAAYVYSAMIVALWPVFAELIAQNAWGQVKRYLFKYLGFGMAYMAICTIAMIWLMPLAFKLLAPNKGLTAPLSIVVFMGLYQVIRVWTDTFAMLLQSMSKLRPFWIFVPVQATLSAGLQWWLAPRYGLTGIVIGLSLSFLLTVSWGLPLAARRYAFPARPTMA